MSVAAALFLLALMAAGIRVQPDGSGRVVLRGSSVQLLPGRVGWTLPFAGKSCVVPLQNGRPYFSRHFKVTTRSGETFSVSAAFTYSIPSSLPAGWSSTDWCAGLEHFVGEQLGQVAGGWKSEDVADRH